MLIISRSSTLAECLLRVMFLAVVKDNKEERETSFALFWVRAGWRRFGGAVMLSEYSEKAGMCTQNLGVVSFLSRYAYIRFVTQASLMLLKFLFICLNCSENTGKRKYQQGNCCC